MLACQSQLAAYNSQLNGMRGGAAAPPVSL